MFDEILCLTYFTKIKASVSLILFGSERENFILKSSLMQKGNGYMHSQTIFRGLLDISRNATLSLFKY